MNLGFMDEAPAAHDLNGFLCVSVSVCVCVCAGVRM